MSEIFGPPITTDLSGLGGPLNKWDVMIHDAQLRGNAKALADLKLARAKFALAFSPFHPVFVDRLTIERMNRANQKAQA